MKFPGSVLASVFLFVAETSAALYLSSTYRSGGDGMWQALTLLFLLLPCALVQLTLLFVHRDFTRDRPLVLLLHLLQLGPLFRCVRDPRRRGPGLPGEGAGVGDGGPGRPALLLRSTTVPVTGMRQEPGRVGMEPGRTAFLLGASDGNCRQSTEFDQRKGPIWAPQSSTRPGGLWQDELVSRLGLRKRILNGR